MPNKTIYVWRIFCQTDNQYEFWKLYDTDPEPTTCPVDTAHTVNLGDVTLRNVISQNQVKIKEEDVPTGGKWAAEAHWFYGASGGISGPSSTIKQLSWKHDVTVFNIQYRSRDENVRDEVSMYVETKDQGFGLGVIGTIQQDSPTGSTGINVAQTIIDNVLAADYIQLTDGTNTTDYIQILSVDRPNRMLIFSESIPFSFAAATPTFIKFRRYVLYYYPLGPPDLYQMGNGKIGGSYVPAGNVVSVVYHNYDSTKDKELYAYIERLE